MMIETKHTPGPWAMRAKKPFSIECRMYAIVNKDRYPAAFTPAWDEADEGGPAAPDEALANARLIAEAPNLLNVLDPDTLEAIADEIDCFAHSSRAGSLRSLAKRQRAAIQRATVPLPSPVSTGENDA